MLVSELKVGQRFEWQGDRCMAVEDHMQAGGIAFAVMSGPKAGQTGYIDGDYLREEAKRLDGEKC